MKVAIIGCGNVSAGHIKAWQETSIAKVAMLVDVEISLAHNMKKEMNLDKKVLISKNYEDALKNKEIDIIDVCTPSHLHTGQIIEALTEKKHLVVEKPTGYNLEECRKLRFYVQKYPESKVAVAYSLRYFPLNIEVRKLIQEGRIGDLTYGQCTWNHPFNPEDPIEKSILSEGPLSDKGGNYIAGSELCHPTHVFDLARYMLGDAEEVFAYKKEYGVYALAVFKNGVMGVLTSSLDSTWGLRNPTVISIQGTKGTIHTMMNRKGEYTGTIIEKDKETSIDVSKETGHGDRIRTQNIISAIQNDEPLIAPLEDSLKTTEFLHAIWDSYNLGIRVPVHISCPTG